MRATEALYADLSLSRRFPVLGATDGAVRQRLGDRITAAQIRYRFDDNDDAFPVALVDGPPPSSAVPTWARLPGEPAVLQLDQHRG